jgi:hypothetical protein
MTAWFLLSLVTGPVFSVHVWNGDPGNSEAASFLFRLAGWAVSAFFAWRVTRGGRISRILLIIVAMGAFIAGVVGLASQFRAAELGAVAAAAGEIALLLSPAVYWRTRPPGQPGATMALWRRRTPAPLVAALAAGAAFGLIGMAVSAAVINGRSRDYDSNTVHVPAGHPVAAVLAPGHYVVFGGCANGNGCVAFTPRDLSIRGYLSGPVATQADEGYQAPDIGEDLFFRDLAFTVPVRELVLFTRLAHPQMAVLIVPAQDKADAVRRWKVSEAAFGVLLLISLAGLASPVRRGVAGRWQ